MGKAVILFCLASLLACCVYHDTDPEVVKEPEISCDTISWQKHIQPIMARSCAVSGCHDGISRLDWRTYSLAKQYAAEIKAQTRSRIMPVDSRLPQKDIDMISCWVESGAQNN